MARELPPLVRPTGDPWRDAATYWGGIDRAVAHLDSPIGIIELTALSHNAYDMLDRAAGVPIRVASKSVRVRSVLDAVLALPGYAGVLGFTLAEALWLAETIDDIVVGYPTADREAIRLLAADPMKASRVTLMVDSVEHLDFIDSVVAPSERETLRVAIELDASYQSKLLGRLGVWRSPVRSPRQAEQLAREIVGRDGFALVGMMSYESQIAGLQDSPPGAGVRGVIVRDMQRRSFAEIIDRRAAAVAAVRSIADLEFVNGGGTGSLHLTRTDSSVTEIAAGSGLFAGHTFDGFAAFTPAPAAAWGLSVVRKPTPDRATVLGGGWVASGPPAADRLPRVVWPEGLSMAKFEMAGEVQTPLAGAAARALEVGDRVWLRHAKSGEVSERLDAFALVDGDTVVGTVPTYRGEGKAFL